jgi:DNA/RNA-binding domain of Phe-tRNA-synthetase-like protein
MFIVSEAWKNAFPEAHAGVLVMRDVANPSHHAGLAERKAALEEQLRSQFAGQDRPTIASHPILQSYSTHYRRFKKTYHVQLQLESIVLKGKSIPNVAALVEAMFMAEMKNLLLTAGHDLDSIKLPLTLDVSKGDEQYTMLQGQEQMLKAGDMMIVDGEGVISDVIYGPDQRTQIHAGTRNAIFTVYAPAGIEETTVLQHLQDIQQNILLITPESQVEMLQVFDAH